MLVGEGPLQLGHHGAFNPELEISGGLPGLAGQPMGPRDIGSAGEPDRAVDYEDLAMIAKVEGEQPPSRERGQELGVANLRGAP